jgi:hypothetical protein
MMVGGPLKSVLLPGGKSSRCGAVGRRQDNVEPLNFHQPHAMTKQEEVSPTALHDQVACGTDRGNVRGEVATQSETRGDETGI